MSSFFGNYIKLSLFGQSHGEAIGITMDNFPAGIKINMADVRREMARRAPGRSNLSTQRTETDEPEIVSGVLPEKSNEKNTGSDEVYVTTGQPLCAIIRNNGQHSNDYGDGVDLLRPGHADYTGHVRYFGFEDWRGGGHFSGRLTAPIVFAGTLCKAYLKEKGMEVYSHILHLGDGAGQVICDTPFGSEHYTRSLEFLKDMTLPVLCPDSAEMMEKSIKSAAMEGNSVGGVIECMIRGVPAGLGAPFFDSVESVLSHLMFSIPAVKGVEFGEGFGFEHLTGTQSNDEMRIDADGEEKKIVLSTNHSGGINGGITNGMPIVFRLVVRATPSVAAKQKTVSVQKMENCDISVKGRHDPCIIPRAVPVVEAMAYIGMTELVKERESCR